MLAAKFAAFLSFKATDQRHIIVLLFETFVGSTSSELQHPWISKIRCKPKKLPKKKKKKKEKKKKKIGLNFEVLLINRSL